MAQSLQFELPQDPSPMPTMGSDDEESFVLLCSSYAPEVDLSFKDLHIEPVQSGPIEEGKELITMELSQLENSMLPQMPDVSQGIKDTDPKISITSISSELPPEEIQQKVNTVIAENIKLRDTIIANHAAMESQYKKVIEWKEEVYKTYQTHKLKFSEAKDFITKLKTEKNVLTFELEKSKEIRAMEQAELLKLKAEFAGKDSSSRNCDTSVYSMEKINLLLETQKELSDLKMKIEEFEKLLKLADSAKSELCAENEELKLKISSLVNNEKIIEGLKEEIQEKNSNIKELKKQIKHKEESTSDTVKNLNTEIINLKSQLCLTINLQEDMDNIRKQLMASQATITGLQQLNTALTAQLATEQQKVKELTKLESMKNDYLAVQQQLEIYKADFIAEKEAKDLLKSEKEQIIKDFRQLQKTNVELNEELKLMRDNGFVLTGSGLSNQASSTNPTTSRPKGSPPLSMFTCPICSLKHRSLKLLEDHVETCIPDPDWL